MSSSRFFFFQDPISGELYIIFPDDIVEAVGMYDWESVRWEDNGDGTVTITKADHDAGDEADHF